MENLVELKIHDMSTTLYPADAYALVLEEVDGGRKLPIIIGQQEAQAIKVMMMKYQPPRPLTHDLFQTLTMHLGATLKQIVIYKAKDGVFYSYLCFDKDGEEFVVITFAEPLAERRVRVTGDSLKALATDVLNHI